MARQGNAEATDPTTMGQDSAFEAEHWAAWFFALLAIVLGVIGMIRGFGYIGSGVGTTSGLPVTFWDSIVWMLPAIASGMLSMALHQTDHHRMRDPEHLRDREEGLWKTEHALAWLMGILSIVLGIIGMLVGFHLIGANSLEPDSLPWLLGSVGTGVLTNTMHGVRHHQLASDADFIVRVVEERVGAPGMAGDRGVVRQPRA